MYIIKVSSNIKNWDMNKWRFFINACFQYTTSNLSEFPSTIYVTSFADKRLKMKLLIDICTVFCRIKKNCTGLHTYIISSRSKHRSLCWVDLLWRTNLLSLSLSKCNKFIKLNFKKVNIKKSTQLALKEGKLYTMTYV